MSHSKIVNLSIERTVNPNNSAITPYRHLLPKVNVADRVSFTLSGAPLGVASALRRTIGQEVPVQRLSPIGAIESTDKYHLVEQIERRLEMIPIKRVHGAKKTYTLEVQNDTKDLMTVTTSHIKGAESIVNANVELFTLNSGCYFKVKLGVIDHIGYIKGFGHFAYASGCVMKALDVEMFDEATGKGTRATQSDTREHLISFKTNGDISPRDLIILACDTLIERCEYIKDIQIESAQGRHILSVQGEDYTIGHLLANIMSMDQRVDVAIPKITDSYGTRGHEVASYNLELVFTCKGDARGVLDDALKRAIEYYEDIKLSLS